MVPMNVGIHEDMDEAAYHADPALSQSQIKTLLDCPARFAHEQANPRQVGDAADLGTVVHTLLLGGPDLPIVVDAADWKTKAAREARNAARASGQVAILASAWDAAQTMAGAVWDHPAAADLLRRATMREVSMRWDSDGVEMRGRIDAVSTWHDGSATVLVDVKSARSAAPRMFARSVLDYGYHIQQAAYTDGWSSLTMDVPDFAFIVVENTAPHLVAVYTLDDVLAEYGWQEYRRGLRVFQECVASGEWPSYPDGKIEAPGWVRRLVEGDEGEGYDPEVWS
jgi:hypothetical protein